MNNTLKATGESLVLDLTLRGGDVVGKLEETGARITETIVTRGGKVTDTFREAPSSSNRRSTPRATRARNAGGRACSRSRRCSRMAAPSSPRRSRATLASLGNLITQHLAEFDRTVKVYGGELVERLGQRTEEVTERDARACRQLRQPRRCQDHRSPATLDERIARFREALDGRIQTLNEALGARVMEIAKSLADGGKEVVGALEKRIDEVSGTIDTRGTKLAETLQREADEIDKALGARALEIANTLDSRITRFQELLVGRVETVASQIEVRGQAVGNAIVSRMEQLSQSIKTNSRGRAVAEQDAAGRSCTRSTRSPAPPSGRSRQRKPRRADRELPQDHSATAAQALNDAGGRPSACSPTLSAASRTGGRPPRRARRAHRHAEQDRDRCARFPHDVAAEAIETISTEAVQDTGRASAERRAGRHQHHACDRTLGLDAQHRHHPTLKQNAAEIERSLLAASTDVTGAVKRSAGEAERALTAVATGVNNTLKQNAGEVERALLGVSAEVARSFVGKADEITRNSQPARREMTHVLDESPHRLLVRASPQEQEVHDRGRPGHRQRGAGDRGQGRLLRPDHDGQQRADRAPHQRRERECDRHGQPHGRRPATAPSPRSNGRNRPRRPPSPR